MGALAIIGIASGLMIVVGGMILFSPFFGRELLQDWVRIRRRIVYPQRWQRWGMAILKVICRTKYWEQWHANLGQDY